MTIVPIQLPPGLYRNGTDYGTRGRWFDGNLVRWHNGSLRPIGGWERRAQLVDSLPMPPLYNDPATETARDMVAYRENDGLSRSVIGTNLGLYTINSSNVVSSITPAAFVPFSNGVTGLFGYGVGPYGAYTYGTPRNQPSSIAQPVKRWEFAMWGENVICLVGGEGPMWEYAPGAANPIVLSNAPESCDDVIVTDERIVMAIKNDPIGGIRQVIWSDREDNNAWAPTVTNYAGSQVLEGIGNLVGLYKVRSEVLILSETDAYIARFLGAPFVYGFTRIGVSCEPIHPHAVAKTDRFAVWLGNRNFWMYDGTLRVLPCDVMDYISATMDPNAVSKMHTLNVSDFTEIWWFYQSVGATEVDTYIAYDYTEGHWNYGKLSRTVGVDQGAYRSPVMLDAAGVVWNHEQKSIIPDGDVFALSGPLELSNGDRNMAVRYVFPDTSAKDDISLEFFTRQMPTEPDYAHGPFEYENPISTTGVLGREVRMKVNGLTNDWELGTMRFDVQQVGGGFR